MKKARHRTAIYILTNQVPILEGKKPEVPCTTAKSCESQAIIKGKVIYTANPCYNGVDYVDEFNVCFDEFIFPH